MTTTALLTRLRDVLGPCDTFTPLHIPIFDDRETELLRECVESNFVSSVGAFCDRFEATLTASTGALCGVRGGALRGGCGEDF